MRPSPPGIFLRFSGLSLVRLSRLPPNIVRGASFALGPGEWLVGVVTNGSINPDGRLADEEMEEMESKR